MAAKKNLKLTKVKAVSKSLDKIEQYTIEEGEFAGETISYHPTFSHDTIEELVTELQLLIKETVDGNSEISDELCMHLIHFLIIKHFTHFRNDIPSTLLGKVSIVHWIEHFRKTGLYKLIIDELFSPTEIQKVFDVITNFTATGIVTNELEKQIQDKVAGLRFKYQDIFKQTDKIGEIIN